MPSLFTAEILALCGLALVVQRLIMIAVWLQQSRARTWSPLIEEAFVNLTPGQHFIWVETPGHILAPWIRREVASVSMRDPNTNQPVSVSGMFPFFTVAGFSRRRYVVGSVQISQAGVYALAIRLTNATAADKVKWSVT